MGDEERRESLVGRIIFGVILMLGVEDFSVKSELNSVIMPTHERNYCKANLQMTAFKTTH